jgi:hypothetical protein
MALETPQITAESDARQAVEAALGPFAGSLDPAALQFLPQKWGAEMAGRSPLQIAAEVTSRLNSPHFAGFFREGQAPQAPIPAADPMVNLKATLEVMGPQLQPGAADQIVKLMGEELSKLSPNLIKEVLASRLSQREYQHFLIPPPPKHMPGSVGEFAERQQQVSGRTPGIGLAGFGANRQALAAGQRADLSSGHRSPPPPAHPADQPLESYDAMKARMAAVRGGDPRLGFLAGSTGLGGKAAQ